MRILGPDDVISFWHDAGPKRWFAKDEGFDAEIKERFGVLHGEAASGEHDHWAGTPEGALALLLVLDQFSRNIHRDEARAFAADEKALSLAKAAIEKGFDKSLDAEDRRWVYMPFMHSEALADQEECVRLFEELGFEENYKYAVLHRDVIAKFGRFPHRNALLGRETTPDEAAYLEEHGGF